MKSEIVQTAIRELVEEHRPIMPKLLRDSMDSRTFCSINQVAGLLDVSPSTVCRLFRDRIRRVGPRQLRICMKDFDEITAALTYKTETKRARLEKKEKDQPKLNL